MMIPQEANLQEFIDFLHFAKEKVQTAVSPISLNEISKEFMSISGSSILETSFNRKIRKNCSQIQNIHEFDTNTKVRFLFAFSAPININYLKKLRKTAYIEVDEYQRITLYQGNDLELKGKHRWSSMGIKRKINSEEIDISSDDSDEEDVSASEHDFSHLLIPKQEIEERKEGKNKDISETRVEEFDTKKARGADRKSEFQFQNMKKEMIEEPTVLPVQDYKPPEIPGITTQSPIVNQNEVPYLRLLESFHTLVLSLNLEVLKKLQMKLEQNINEASYEEYKTVSIDPVRVSLDICLFLIHRSSNFELSFSNETSTSLKEFLLLFRQFIISLKLPALDSFRHQLTNDINELNGKDKRVSMEKVKSALKTVFVIIVP